MRYAALAFAVAIISSASPVRASISETLYFWEDARHYGWSDIPDGRQANPPPKDNPAWSLRERCARLVGRLLQRDQGGLVYAIQLEDACVRNGGKL